MERREGGEKRGGREERGERREGEEGGRVERREGERREGGEKRGGRVLRWKYGYIDGGAGGGQWVCGVRGRGKVNSGCGELGGGVR